MTLEGLGEVFKGDSADMCAGKFLLVSMGERADPSSVLRRGARTPIGAGRICLIFMTPGKVREAQESSSDAYDDEEEKKKREKIEALGKKWVDTESEGGSNNNGDGEHEAEVREEVDQEQEERRGKDEKDPN